MLLMLPDNIFGNISLLFFFFLFLKCFSKCILLEVLVADDVFVAWILFWQITSLWLLFTMYRCMLLHHCTMLYNVYIFIYIFNVLVVIFQLCKFQPLIQYVAVCFYIWTINNCYTFYKYDYYYYLSLIFSALWCWNIFATFWSLWLYFWQ